MGASTVAKYVKCPYFKKNDAVRIVCEGVCNRSTLHTAFESKELRKEYMGQYCNSIFGCRDCLIHMALNQKYEEDGEIG